MYSTFMVLKRYLMLEKVPHKGKNPTQHVRGRNYQMQSGRLKNEVGAGVPQARVRHTGGHCNNGKDTCICNETFDNFLLANIKDR